MGFGDSICWSVDISVGSEVDLYDGIIFGIDYQYNLGYYDGLFGGLNYEKMLG